MTLVDTSVWIDHFRKSNPEVVQRLHDDAVACHPFVIGELALGNLRHRTEILELLQALPTLDVAPDRSVLAFVDRNRLAATGWVDAHLLAAVDAAGIDLLTHDSRLRRQAARLRLAAPSQP